MATTGLGLDKGYDVENEVARVAESRLSHDVTSEFEHSLMNPSNSDEEPAAPAGTKSAYRNFKLSTKLILGFVVSAMICAILGAFGTYKLHSISDAFSNQWSVNSTNLENLGALQNATAMERVYINRMYAVSKDPVERKDMFKELHAARERSHDVLSAYEATIDTDPVEFREADRKLVAEFKSQLREYESAQDVIATALNTGNYAEAPTRMQEIGKVGDAVTKSVKDLLQFNVKLGKDSATALNTSARSAIQIMAFAVMVAVGLAILLGILLSRAIIKPLQDMTAVAKRIAMGDVSQRIEHRSGDEIGMLADAFRTVSSTLASLVSEMQKMSSAHNVGDTEVKIPDHKFKGSFRVMASGVNEMVASHVFGMRMAITCLQQFGDGKFDVKLEQLPGKKAILNRTVDKVRANLKALIADTDMLVDAAANHGRLDVRADASKHSGDFGKIVEGINQSFEAIAKPLSLSIDHLDKLSRGVNCAQITHHYEGDLKLLRDGFNKVFASIDALIDDSTHLVQAALEGKLKYRANAERHQGDFRKIVQGVNDTLDAVIHPMQDVTSVLEKLAGGDFTAEVRNEHAGDFSTLTKAVNTVSSSVRTALEEIGRNVSSLAGSAQELKNLSTSMGANADETATQASVVSAAAEQVSNNVQTVATGADEMSASIKEIAKNTAEATRVATSAVRTAEVTNQTISKLGQSSAEIGQVIKVITSIAQQTNLLALNATIEAARAGEAGKGFAVVANEVKELAKETAKATEDISRKIEAIQSDTSGAVSAISQISQVIGQISDIQTTIASAIEEQSATTNEIGRTLAEAAKGSTDISKNIGGVAEAARATTVGATNTSTSAHTLEKMAAELQTLVSQFRY